MWPFSIWRKQVFQWSHMSEQSLEARLTQQGMLWQCNHQKKRSSLSPPAINISRLELASGTLVYFRYTCFFSLWLSLCLCFLFRIYIGYSFIIQRRKSWQRSAKMSEFGEVVPLPNFRKRMYSRTLINWPPSYHLNVKWKLDWALYNFRRFEKL